MSRTLLDRQEVLGAVYRAVDTVNELRTADEQLPKAPELVLFGADSTLDSLAFTTLVLSIERNIEDLAGINLELLGSDADLAELRTISAATDLIMRRLAE